MSTLRKILISLFSLLLIGDVLFVFALLGAPHNNADDFKTFSAIGIALLFAIILTWQSAKRKETN
jgi:hypothetical protein